MTKYKLPEVGMEREEIRILIEQSLRANRWQNSRLNAGRVYALPDEFAIELRNQSENIANIGISSPYLANSFYELEDRIGQIMADLLGHSNPEEAEFLTVNATTHGLIESLHNEICRYNESPFRENYPPVILAPITANVAIKKAAKLTGLGIENIVWYDLDENFQPEKRDLEEKTLRILSSKMHIVAVIAVAGDTEHGIVQDASKFSIVKEIQGDYTPAIIVDAAFGWYFLIGNESRLSTTFHNPDVDYIVLDFHKWVGPATHAMVFLNEGRCLKYLLLDEDRAIYEGKNWNFPYSREYFLRSRAAMTRLSISAHNIPANLGALLKYGRNGLDEMSSQIRDLAEKFANYLRKSEMFQLICKPETGVVSFSLKQGSNYGLMEEFNNGVGYMVGYSTTIRCRSVHDLQLHISERDGLWIHFMPYANINTLNAYINRLDLISKNKSN